MKLFVSLFLMLITTSVFAGLGGYIGEYDNRSYGSLKMSQYSAVAQLKAMNKDGWSGCTGTFVDKNLILTNTHCALPCVNEGRDCIAEFWDGKQYVTTKTTPIMLNEGFQTYAGNDWALMMAYDGNPNVKNVSSTTSLGGVERGGYGTLRVIGKDELPIIRKIVEEVSNKYGEKCSKERDWFECWYSYIEEGVKKAGLKPLNNDDKNFKIQKCNITRNVFVDEGVTYANMVSTDCDSAGGDSGASLFRGNIIVGLNNSGGHGLFFTDKPGEQEVFSGGRAVKNQNFYPYIDEAKRIVAQRLNGTWVEPKSEVQSEQQPAKKKPITDKATMKRMYEQYINGFQCD